ncbi:hypothetical protein M8J77_015729 [Diaphorina citri]|nr:hypothetical protein M8J77_015729 [Diaphorina citri]
MRNHVTSNMFNVHNKKTCSSDLFHLSHDVLLVRVVNYCMIYYEERCYYSNGAAMAQHYMPVFLILSCQYQANFQAK